MGHLAQFQRRWRDRAQASAGRLAICAGAGMIAALLVTIWRFQAAPSDLLTTWAGARVLWQGGNPYAEVGPGSRYHWEFPLFYPLPAIALLLPLAWLPLAVAQAIIVALGAIGLAWLATRDGVSPLMWVFPSFAYLNAVHAAQWSPLLVVGALVPSLGFVLAAKPTIGAALWLAYPSRRTLTLAALFVLITLVIWPWWPQAWLQTLRAGDHLQRPPVTLAGGPLILLALWRWRHPPARLLVAMACVPQTTHGYEAVPLFLIPQTHREGAALCGLTIVAKLLWNARWPYPDHLTGALAMGQWMVWLIYLPCLVMVLLRRE